MNETNDVEQLKKMKLQLQERQMSVMVGAGFSKNVSTIFPSWWQLLYDLADFLLEGELKDWFEKHKALSKKPLSEAQFRESQIERYIEETGFLELVSKFIKRKGFREAIATYIEERTPSCIKKGDKRLLVNKLSGITNSIPLTNDMLFLHRKLVKLPWNNILTTNYDEMLELSTNSATRNELQNEIDFIRKQIQENGRDKAGLIEELNELESNSGDKNKIFQLRGELSFLERKLSLQEKDLGKLKSALGECLSIVTTSSHLSLKRNKNIIKLHGSLRKKGGSYGFDGDSRVHYIIAKEDYETYPQKHEAFTQLMRISLLQESYCLIGFSASDPNFIEWIKWVRDILEKDKTSNVDYKIYLIDVDPNPSSLPNGKELFFENHRIYRICLGDKEVLDFLSNKTGLSVPNTLERKDLINLFLSYLSGSAYYDKSEAILEIYKRRKYQRLWDNLTLTKPSSFELASTKEIAKSTIQIIDEASDDRFPQVGFAYNRSKQKLLSYLGEILSNADKKDKYIKKILMAGAIAMNDTLLIPSFAWQKKDIDKISSISKSFPKEKIKLDLLKLREACLFVDSKETSRLISGIDVSDSLGIEFQVTYNKILLKAFTLDFSGLKEELDKWETFSYWNVRKAGMLAIFDNGKALKLLEEYHHQSEIRTNEEQLYTISLLHYLYENQSHYEKSRLLREVIQVFEQFGFGKSTRNIESILEDIKGKPEKIKPHGSDRSIISNGFSFSNDLTLPQKGLQFIQLLLNSGYPLSLNRVHYKGHDEWYIAFKAIFEYLPYPALFYSLQYQNDDFLKRIGQDYSFSDNLEKELPSIMHVLANAYKDKKTPHRIRRSILLVGSEMAQAVPPKNWEHMLLTIWQDKKVRKKLFSRYREVENLFSKTTILFIQNLKTVRSIIKVCIENKTSNEATVYTYRLAQNPILEKKGEKIQDPNLKKQLDTLITGLPNDENGWFLIANLWEILSNKQREEVQKSLRKIDFMALSNERIWKVLTYYAKGDKKLIAEIKKGVSQNKRLWDAGFTDKGLSSISNYIPLSHFIYSRYHSSFHLDWTKAEARKVFSSMSKELKKIEDWLSRRSDHNFRFVLQEMSLFLDDQETNLKGISKYKSTRLKVNEMYNSHRGYETIFDGLTSKESTEVKWALGDLSFAIRKFKDPRHWESEFTLVLNKLVLMEKTALEDCMEFAADWMSNDSTLVKLYKEELLRILTVYSNDNYSDVDRSFVELQMIKMAKSLANVGSINTQIEYWIQAAEKSRFNQVKYSEIKLES